MKNFFVLCLALISILTQSSNAQEWEGSRPNIVFILADDMGWKDPGFMGNTYHETPNLDRLSKMGTMFTNAYANAPNCAPTRASLMTGQYTPRHGIFTVATAERGKSENRKLIPPINKHVLAPAFVTFPELLQKEGYATASMGKWHLGGSPRTNPLAQGFDVNIGGDQRGSPRSYFSPYKNEQLPDGPEGEYLTDRLTDEALSFIDDNKEKPFFLYLTHFAVHTPLQGKKELVDKYDKKPRPDGIHNPKYGAMVESLDESVGRVMDKLSELGLEENTIVVFFSDNGPYFRASEATPLRGSKGMLYEGGIREPLVIYWKGHTTAGKVIDEPVIGTDFYPTFLDLAGIKKDKQLTLDGESLLPLLEAGKSLEREALYWHFPAYLEPYGGMKEKWRQVPASAIRMGDWKLIENFETGALALYNLKTDMSESINLAEREPEKREELFKALTKWRLEVNAPIPVELNPEYKESNK
ncbi:sulfatase [Roseivirga sp. E12]|uniref:sulfatase n=1 Tax=Roseivirga sp. E12 TaxID=2819237 RepID=UPI001ABCCBCA|nr:sulfatase [Roseivirga sp. E12]MBO3699921.1 sulfatase [Roseivirga sp. E12]